ncbi:MAG: HAMP domain-containing protein [Magnetospirillum sp. WYHS-4]
MIRADDLTLARLVSPADRLRLHGLALVAPLFLAVYGKLVCPFIDGIAPAMLAFGLGVVTVFHLALRELLFRRVPYRQGEATPARFGFRLSVIAWLAAGVVAVVVHALLYPDFPWASHLKLITGYGALGAGLLAQLEYGALERAMRRAGIALSPVRPERMAHRLLEKFLVFTGVPALTVTMMVGRYIGEGFIGIGVGIEVVFLVVLFLLAAQAVAWNYGTTLGEDTRGLVAGLDGIAAGRFDVRLDASRADELGQVAQGINGMAEGLALRERIRDAFGRFVSPEVAESVIRDNAASGKAISLGGGRRDLTILMADLRDFTPLSETLAPEALTDTLNLFFTEMVAAIQEQGGMVDKFMGDAVMAVFGLVPERGCPARSAVAAGLGMLQRLDGLNRQRAARGEPPLRVGIGIHRGEVVAGYLGSLDRLEFTVIGHAVNLAQRIESEARGDRPPLLFSAEVAERIEGTLPLRLVGKVSLKGIEHPVELFTIDIKT